MIAAPYNVRHSDARGNMRVQAEISPRDSICGMDTPPWSAKQLKKLGVCIRDEVEVPAGIPQYDDVMLHYSDVAAETQEKIQELDWAALLDSRPFEVTSRPKTIDTLRQKLKRDRSTPLSNIQDIAGVRFEAEMSLDEQDAVATAIAGKFGQNLEVCRKDLRATPRSGYRAVHLWLRLPTRVEVQIRTHLQSSWANMYESLADLLGREIRYGEFPGEPPMTEVVRRVQALSIEDISSLEDARNRILPQEDVSRLAWEAAATRFPGSEGDLALRKFASARDRSVRELRDYVSKSEESIKSSMDSLKASFDSLRHTRR